MHYICINPDDIDGVWDTCAEQLKPACDLTFGTVTLDSIYNDICNGNMLLWVAVDKSGIHVSMTSELHLENGVKYCIIGQCGGEGLETVKALEETVCEWATANGCDSVFIHGRKGWLKALDGYEVAYTAIVKRLAK